MTKNIKRVKTGVPGLDEEIDGGLPEGSLTLLTGGPGSGKMTFCSQFMINGAENGEKCLYITTGQKPEEIKEDARQFGRDFDEHDNLAVAYVSPVNNASSQIKNEITERNFDRIVLDSISVFEMNWGENNNIRKYIKRLVEHFRDLSATVLMTSERPETDTGKLSRFGITEFVVDGVIVLNGFALGETTYRSARLVKMRRTNISGNNLSVDIDSSGISMYSEDKL